jgi:hypothetical protein
MHHRHVSLMHKGVKLPPPGLRSGCAASEDYADFFCAARFAAQYLCLASLIRFRPAALTFLLAFGAGFAAGAALPASARFAAIRRLSALMMFCLPCALSVLLALGASFVAVSGSAAAPDVPLIAAHRRCCASFIRFRVAALTFRLLGDVDVLADGAEGAAGAVLVSMTRSSAICASMSFFWASNPLIAASMMAVVSCGT